MSKHQIIKNLIAFFALCLLSSPFSSAGARNTLNIYNWWSYIDDQTIKEFEQKYNVKINLEIYQTNEELIEKLLSGGDRVYDLIFPTDRFIKTLRDLGLISKLNRALIQDVEYLRKDLPNAIYDPNNEYSLPYQWGTIAVIFNERKVNIEQRNWDTLFNPPEYLKGKIAISSNLREAIAAALTHNGYDINTCNKEELLAAENTLLKIKPYVKMIKSDIVPALVKEDIWLALSWQGEGIFARRFNPYIDFYIPSDEPIVFCDVVAIPNHAPNKKLAHQFINFVLSPETNARISNYTAYNTPNLRSVQYITDKHQRELHDRLIKGSRKYKYIEEVKCVNEYNRVWRNFISK